STGHIFIMLALLQNLVEQYGYWAVAAGCVVDGEITILLCAAAVHGGLLKLAWVMLAAFTGTMLSDIASYLIGRHLGQAALARRSRRWRARARLTERDRQSVGQGQGGRGGGGRAG